MSDPAAELLKAMSDGTNSLLQAAREENAGLLKVMDMRDAQIVELEARQLLLEAALDTLRVSLSKAIATISAVRFTMATPPEPPSPPMTIRESEG